MRKTAPRRRLTRLPMVTLAVLLAGASLSLAADEQVPAEKPLHEATWQSVLGAFVISMSGPLAADLGLPEKGMLVAAVLKGSTSDEAGIRRGDLIVSLEIVTEPVAKVEIGVLRDSRQLSLTAPTRKHGWGKGQFVEPAASSAKPRTIVVDPSGGGDYRTITAALMTANPGDTVRARDGVYREGLLVPGGVTLEAAEARGVHIRAATPLRVVGARDVTLRGLSLAGGWWSLSVDNSEGVTLEDCDIAAGQASGAFIADSTDVLITGCSFIGTPKATGIFLQATKGRVTNNIISSHWTGIMMSGSPEVDIAENLFDANRIGISASDSKLTARKNTITGTGADGKGIHGSKAEIHLAENSIRSHLIGVHIEEGKGDILNNLISQNGLAISITSGEFDISENALLSNTHMGVFLDGPADAPDGLRKVRITKNTISANGGTGIHARRIKAEIRYNLLDGNGNGVIFDNCQADVRNNTIVLQKGTGIGIGADCQLAIYNNIVAFNRWGISFDVSSKWERGFNNVFGNIASRDLPAVDGNYFRRDWIGTRSGDKIQIVVYPAYDLKADTDISVDPKFVRTGSDYRLLADSPLADRRGEDSLLIGAFPVQPCPAAK